MSQTTSGSKRIKSFRFAPGDRLAGKFEVMSLLGAGWEGEVYKLRELGTGVERAGKLFFPHRNVRGKAARFYAKKLHKLRHCPILIQYHSQETVAFEDQPIKMLVSEFVEGTLLTNWLKQQPGKRISAFQGMHLLHALAVGMEPIHDLREYHGDLHSGNIIIQRHGISFDLKLLDMFQWGHAKAENIHDDVCDMIRIFYDSTGGSARYRRQPEAVKNIVMGLKRSLIIKKFRNASQLRHHLENMEW